MIRRNLLNNGIWFLLSGLLLFLALNYHAKAKAFTYQSQIWSDKAGYQVYLPYLFLYQANANNFPDSIEIKTGKGYTLDDENHTLHTKYTSGVAILQAPFFLIAHFIASIGDQPASGFSAPYQKSIDFASVFYCVLGLFFLYKSLNAVTDKKYVIGLTLIALLFGSNLLYYTIDETGMSHVYSFFLFSIFLFGLQKSDFLKKGSIKWYLLLGLTFGLITLIRPTNSVIIFVYFFWRYSDAHELKARFSRLLLKNRALIIPLSVLLVWLPQMLFWKYNEGTWLHYSYGEEGFDFLHPQLSHVLFSAKHGAFIYGSVLFLSIVWVIRMVIKKSSDGFLYLSLFLFVVYLTASWHDPSFGCSYGVRNLAEYQALLAFPLLGLFKFIGDKQKGVQIAFSLIVIGILAINVLMVYGFGGCSLVSDHWDYGQIVERMDL